MKLMKQPERARPRYREIGYCPRCGVKYRPTDFREQDFVFDCAACTFDFYQNPLPSSVVAIAHPEQPDWMLMLCRRTPPGIGQWCVPGGFMRYGEDAAAAAAREVLEEVGLRVEIGPVLNVGTMHYCYRDRQVFVVEVGYLARLTDPLPERFNITAEASEMRFEPVAKVLAEPERLAFPGQIPLYRAFRDRVGHPW